MEPESIPLVIVALLLISAGGTVERVDMLIDGNRQIDAGPNEAVVVAGGTGTVPAGERVEGSVYVVEGRARIDGTVTEDVVQLGGNVTMGETASVGGEYQFFAGNRSIAPGADVARRNVVGEVTPRSSPLADLVFFALQTAVLATAAFLIARRFPDVLDNVAAAAAEHPAVSTVVGLLSGVTFLALFVFMAFTLVLIPVSVAGIGAGILVVAYGQVCLGYLLGRQVYADRPPLAGAAGVVALSVAVELLGYVPYVGSLVNALLLVAGLGAVVITYFGLRRFEPPTLRPVE